MSKANLLFVTILLVILSCNSETNVTDFVEYSDGKQLLTVNNIDINGNNFEKPVFNIIAPDSILINQEFIAKIFLAETGMSITNAYVDCEINTRTLVDTSTYKVSDCKKELLVKNDTIIIGFKPTSLGVKTFSPIAILTKDKNSIFRTFEFKFNYVVFDN